MTGGRSGRNPVVQYAGILSYMLLLIMRIPLIGMIGDAGMGLFAPAFEIFVLVTLLTSYSMTGAMSGIIRYRVKREQYKSAKKAFQAAFLMDLLISAVFALVLLGLSGMIADILILESMSYMAVMVTAPVIVFAAFIGTFRGYFNGYGLGVLTAHSQYIEKISMIICVLCCGSVLYRYGEKVSALRQDDVYSFAHGALGAMIGVLLSQIITTVYLLVIYVIYSGTLRGKLGMDGSKRIETQYSMQRVILANCLPLAVIAILSNVYMLIDQRMFNYCMNKKELGGVRTALWGSYYGRLAVLIGLGACCVILSIYTMPGKISNSYDREEYRVMRDRISRAVRRVCLVGFPVAVYLAALADSTAACLVKGGNEDLASWIRAGAVIIVLYGFCFLLGQLMYKIHMFRELLAVTAGSLLLHWIIAYLFVQKALMGAEGIIAALIISFAANGALSFYFVSRHLKYRQEWFSGVAFPAAAAAVSGLAVMLVDKFLLASLGGLPTILIGVLTGLILYVAFLMILRVIGEEELSHIPLGFFFIMLGKNLGIF